MGSDDGGARAQALAPGQLVAVVVDGARRATRRNSTPEPGFLRCGANRQALLCRLSRLGREARRE